LITEAEAQRRLRDVLGGAIVSTVRFGVLEIPDLLATQHFLLLGTTGSGKTTLLQMMLNSVLPGLKPGSNRRALIYDAKRDVLSFLANFSVPVKTLHPYHREGVAWDIAADVRDDELIGEIADIFVPQQNQTQPVFSEGARALLAGVMQSFVELAPDPKKPAWTLRDVMLATRYRRRMEIILNATTRARHLVEKFLDKSDFTRSLDSSLTIALRRLGYVAAAWDAATEKVSLVEWASSESVLVLGSDPTREGTLRQLNSVILKRLSQLLLHKDEAIRQPGRTWIFVDELIRAGKLEGLGDLLHEGRSKGVAVCVGFQDLPGLYAEFGEHEGRSIVSQCSHKLFLKAGDPVTAEYAADQLSEQEIERVRVSQNQGASRGTTRSGMHDRSESDQHSRGYSTSRETEKRHVVMPGEILGLPLGDWQRGIDGYYDCPAVGEPFRGHVSPALIAQTPKPKKEVANFDERKPGPLREWDQKDLARLGLSKYPELLGGPPPGQASSSGWDKIGL
jgi:type IV secretory pathway TraG/TraD family ATPase VirD4